MIYNSSYNTSYQTSLEHQLPSFGIYIYSFGECNKGIHRCQGGICMVATVTLPALL